MPVRPAPCRSSMPAGTVRATDAVDAGVLRPSPHNGNDAEGAPAAPVHQEKSP